MPVPYAFIGGLLTLCWKLVLSQATEGLDLKKNLHRKTETRMETSSSPGQHAKADQRTPTQTCWVPFYIGDTFSTLGPQFPPLSNGCDKSYPTSLAEGCEENSLEGSCKHLTRTTTLGYKEKSCSSHPFILLCPFQI